MYSTSLFSSSSSAIAGSGSLNKWPILGIIHRLIGNPRDTFNLKLETEINIKLPQQPSSDQPSDYFTFWYGDNCGIRHFQLLEENRPIKPNQFDVKWFASGGNECGNLCIWNDWGNGREGTPRRVCSRVKCPAERPFTARAFVRATVSHTVRTINRKLYFDTINGWSYLNCSLGGRIQKTTRWVAVKLKLDAPSIDLIVNT